MTTFFGRRIDAMYQGCSRSSLVAVSTRERAIRRTFYELCIKGWTLSFFSSPSFERIKVRCQCCCKKQIDNNFPCPTIFFNNNWAISRALIGRRQWSKYKHIMDRTLLWRNLFSPSLRKRFSEKLRSRGFTAKYWTFWRHFHDR